ncbi:recombination-associated protein RdgC [Halomonas denitrificans]|uniref:recombination-associated protein RdgC n=1 Tax=Halomonas TaxID=2745 RepID=UPI001A8F45D7|nr:MULTISPECIES: recombination-associated protein RdgC [Halomonas]MED5294488.1 recombination-associated protein RdgC [Pseudomonadota bacterium]MBN8411030.1 recombination-associated protein RdgC [Halomonas litopenaei]MBY5929383.1 recombination-associated protein RdgC [Halomonas sp. DP8Y7-3]MBY5986235.1 recombination-associated protein RdgC [Halomonas sp. DP5Y7-2]MBY6030342.1 recombination-associated protein RdgC [Halomonas sp. DP8Y7-1]
MWFKHLHLYRLHDASTLDSEQLETALAEQAFRPLGSSEARRSGWTAPAGRGSDRYLHELQGQRLMTALRQERILPASVVKEEVEERVEVIEAQESRKLRRQEKQAIKEQVYEELLPRAFVRSQKTDLWWDTRRNLIAVNSSSRKRAEELLDLLRETLGSLKVTPLAAQTLPIRAMTTWLNDASSRPADMLLGDQVELKAKGDDGVLKARQVDLDGDDIQQLLEGGRQASKLALAMEGRLRFVLHDDLAVKSLAFDDALIDEANQADDGDDAVLRMETDFILMAQTLGDSVDRLIDWLGGEAQSNSVTATDLTATTT